MSDEKPDRIAALERIEARYRHLSGDEDGSCVACVESDEEDIAPHTAGYAGDDALGPICWCGHGIAREDEPLTNAA